MALFRALRHRPFALLWVGQVISRLGDSLFRIALVWWVIEQTGTATVMGTVLILSFLPKVLFAFVGGVVVDRLPRVRILLVSDLLSAVIILGGGLLALNGRLEIWHVYIGSILFGLISSFFQPAYTVLVPELTPADSLTSANSLTSLSNQTANVLGPALSAFIIAGGGTSIAFLINGLSFLVSAACLALLGRLMRGRLDNISASNPPAAEYPETAPLEADMPGASGWRSLLRDVREGFDTVLKLPWLWITITILTLAYITEIGPFNVALPFLIKDTLNESVDVLGIVYSMAALGSVITTVWLGRFVRLRRRGVIAYSALILDGAMILAFGFSNSMLSIFVVALIFGAASAAFGLIWLHMMQENIPRDVLGRISSIDQLSSLFMPLGYAITGWATDQIGASAVFIVGGVLTVGMTVLGLFHPAIRKFD